MEKMRLETVMVNDSAEKAMVRLLFTLFDGVAYLDPETVRINIERGTPYGFSRSDRTINSAIADYLLSNYAWIFFGLIVNSEFRKVFVEAVSIEISLDELDRNKVKEIRRDLKREDINRSKENYVIDFSYYDVSAFRRITSKLRRSFEYINHYADTIDSFAENLTEDECLDIGFCVSNFMYLIRAFAKNDIFSSYVRSVLDSVMEELL